VSALLSTAIPHGETSVLKRADKEPVADGRRAFPIFIPDENMMECRSFGSSAGPQRGRAF